MDLESVMEQHWSEGVQELQCREKGRLYSLQSSLRTIMVPFAPSKDLLAKILERASEFTGLLSSKVVTNSNLDKDRQRPTEEKRYRGDKEKIQP